MLTCALNIDGFIGISKADDDPNSAQNILQKLLNMFGSKVAKSELESVAVSASTVNYAVNKVLVNINSQQNKYTNSDVQKSNDIIRRRQMVYFPNTNKTNTNTSHNANIDFFFFCNEWCSLLFPTL